MPRSTRLFLFATALATLAAHNVGPASASQPNPTPSRQLNIRLYDPTVTGQGPTGAQVHLELRAPGARVAKATGQGAAAFFGLFNIQLQNSAGDPVDILPGDTLHLEFVGTPAVDFKVPELTAVADVDTNTVSGKAPPDANLTVSSGNILNGATVTATVSAAGTYRATFTGQGSANDLVPGSAGQVSAALTAPSAGLNVTVARTWAVTQLAVRLGEPNVTGVASAGPPVQLTLLDKAGAQRGTAAAQVPGGGGFFGIGAGAFQAAIAGKNGDPVDILPFYVLQFRRPGESFDLPIPLLTGLVDVDADRVTGQAPAGSPVRVTAGQIFNTRTAVVTATAEGAYDAEFAGNLDIAGGTQVTVEITRPGGHLVSLATAAASLRVWPEVGLLDGTVANGAVADARVLPKTGNVPLATGAATANFLGNFTTELRDAAGNLYFPRSDERVRVQFGVSNLEMRVAPLGIEWDIPGDRVYGETVPGGRVSVTALALASGGQGVGQGTIPGQGGAPATVAVTVTASGFYEVKFAGKADLRPGSRLQVTYTDADGNRERIDRTIPFLNVQVGGNAVSGFALPRASVKASLVAGGSTLGTGAEVAANDAAFDLRVADNRRASVAIAEGQTVDAEFDLRHVRVPVGRLSAVLDPAAETLSGSGPVSHTLGVRWETPLGVRRAATANVNSDQQGAFTLKAPAGITVTGGTRAEVSYLNDDGHRLYALALVPQLVAYLGTSQVVGQAPPLAPLTLALTGGASSLGRGSGVAESDGRFLVKLAGSRPPNVAPNPAPNLAAGQRLAMTVGGRIVEMVLDDVRLALDGNQISGRITPAAGPMPAVAELHVYFRSGAAPRNLNAPIDAAGNFSYDAANPPLFGGAAIDMSTVARIEAVYTAQSGNQTIATVRPRLGVYLPLVRNR